MKKNWSEIERHWQKLQGMIAFDLTAPCIVIDQRGELMETTLSNLTNHLRVSTALATPQMKRYMSLAKKVGPEKAMQAMLEAIDQEAEEFLALYNEAKHDIALIAMQPLTIRLMPSTQQERDSTPIPKKYL